LYELAPGRGKKKRVKKERYRATPGGNLIQFLVKEEELKAKSVLRRKAGSASLFSAKRGTSQRKEKGVPLNPPRVSIDSNWKRKKENKKTPWITLRTGPPP